MTALATERALRFGDFLKFLPTEAAESFNKAKDLPNQIKGFGLNLRILPVPVVDLFVWMDLYHLTLGKHGLTNSFLAELVIDDLNKSEPRLGFNLTPNQQIGIVAGSTLHDLGQLTFTRSMIEEKEKPLDSDENRIRLKHPAIGAYIFWENTPTDSIPMDLKKTVTAAILYHQLDYGSVNDEIIDSIKLREVIPGLPSIKQVKYRKVAVIVSLIDTAVSVLENRKNHNGDPPKKLRGILDRRIGKIKRYFSKFEDFIEEEIKLYYRVKNIILRYRQSLYTNLIAFDREFDEKV